MESQIARLIKLKRGLKMKVKEIEYFCSEIPTTQHVKIE